MGPYCKFCDHRCFLERVLADGRTMLLATCSKGMEHDRERVGQDHTTALNPITDQEQISKLRAALDAVATAATEDRDYVTEISQVIRRFPNRTDPDVLGAAIAEHLNNGEACKGCAGIIAGIIAGVIRRANPDFEVGAGALADHVWHELDDHPIPHDLRPSGAPGPGAVVAHRKL